MKTWLKKGLLVWLAFALVISTLPAFGPRAEEIKGDMAPTLKTTAEAKPVEVVEERTENEIVYDNQDGSFTKEIYMEPIHVKEDGEWEPISNDVTKTTKIIEPERTEIQAAFLPTMEQGKYSVFGEGNQAVTFSLVSASGENGTMAVQKAIAKTEANEIRYSNVFPKIDLRNLTFNTSVKEDIVLHEYTGYNMYTFQVNTLLAVKKIADGSIVFEDTTGNVRYTLPKPVMTDSKIHPDTGNATESDNVDFELKKMNDTTYEIILTADEAWLKDTDRVYPIYIDPSVQLKKVVDAGISSVTPTTNYSGSKLWDAALNQYVLKVGRYDDTTGFNYAYVKPDTSSLANATIESAMFKAYAVWHHSSTAKNPVKLEEVTGDWTTTGVTWNNRPTTFNVGSVDIGRNQWASFDVTSSVRAWTTGARPNKGFMMHTVNQQDHWKKFTATETGTNVPYLEVTYTYDKPEKAMIKTVSNGVGTGTGAMNLTWDKVPGATGYKVIIGNGYNYEQFAVGNVTSWTTKGKGIFPTKAEIDKGLYTFHKDGKGTEFANDPRALYENGYKAGSTFGLRNQTKYIVRILAIYPGGDGPTSDITDAYMPPEATPAKPEKSTIQSYSSGAGTETGYMDISWQTVPGAVDYKVVIGNGYNYEYFNTGNVTKWSTKGKKIFPTQEEIDNGLYKFHKDGTGEEFANDPRTLYENGYQAGSTFGLREQEKYIVRILAVYPWGDGPTSDITSSYMPLATPAPPVGEAYANAEGTATGYVTLDWDEIEGADGYKVTIFDGKKNVYFDVGEERSWTSKNKGVWPTKEEVSSGQADIHTDGKGEELAKNPSQVYKNAGSVLYGEATNYWFRVQAYVNDGERNDSEISNVYKPSIPTEQELSYLSTKQEVQEFLLRYLEKKGLNIKLDSQEFKNFVKAQVFEEIDAVLAERADYLYVSDYLIDYLDSQNAQEAINEDNYTKLIDSEIEEERAKDIDKAEKSGSRLFATAEENYGLNESIEMEKVIDKYSEYDKEISDAKDAELEKLIQERDLLYPDGEPTLRSSIAGIKLVKQKYNHWCGPANLAQALSYHMYKKRSVDVKAIQNNFGIQMGYSYYYGKTTSQNMAVQINRYKNTYGFSKTPYITATIKEFGSGAANKIRTRLDGVLAQKSNAPMVLVHQLYLSKYPAKTNPEAGHYLTIGGVRKYNGTYQAQAYNTDSKHNMVWWENIGTGVGQNNTLTKAMYQKNISSPNPVFVY
ncbi:DNRLRE domain-containing protein [Listeria booriae]|uniref:DNRLRE domain-containing protein n=1 Tax=Listeria booriae TaxID=1552123 RepID=A0A841Y9G6_9LIST|nr:DNRLRE domain-containing protein [Listeria booriae]MBC1373549.1 DNRLRE domain-containing protein [Listeria booriae]